MLFTKECDYAIRIMRALSNGGIVRVSDICDMEHISTSMAYKLTRKLEKSDFIKSHRGVNGGYSLKRNLSEITLLDICDAMDRELLLMECMSKNYQCEQNSKAHKCTVHNEFCRIQQLLFAQLKKKSLEELFSQNNKNTKE